MQIKDVHLNPHLLKAVRDMGYTEPTVIQLRCIPEILKGKDVFGQSRTGSGKTVAFALPILNKISVGKGIQALVLTPTRELCVQVTDVFNELGKWMRIRATSIYGGVGIGAQVNAIRNSDVIVGTPGRILDHLQRGTISFHQVRFLVLDEADKMFEMGFIEDVEKIIRHVPKQRQTLLFSATLSQLVHNVVRKYLHDPISIKIDSYVDKSHMKQVYYDLRPNEKFSLLVHLLKKATPGLALVFCGTRREVDAVAKNLKLQAIKAMAIHGGLTQNKRLHALNSLKNENINVLVATDVAARGLDIKNVSHVYNYDVPKTSGEYIHRIGRTARAGMAGDAVTLLIGRDHENFRRVLSDRSLEISKASLPNFSSVSFIREFRKRHQFGQSFKKRWRT